MLALKPKWAEAHNNLGIALYDKHDYDGAMAEYTDSIRIRKDYRRRF